MLIMYMFSKTIFPFSRKNTNMDLQFWLTPFGLLMVIKLALGLDAYLSCAGITILRAPDKKSFAHKNSLVFLKIN